MIKIILYYNMIHCLEKIIANKKWRIMICSPESRIEKKDYSTFFSVKNKYTKIYYLK